MERLYQELYNTETMKQIILALLVIVTVISLIVVTFTINQVSREDQRLKGEGFGAKDFTWGALVLDMD